MIRNTRSVAGRAFTELAHQADPHHFGEEHEDGLAHHHRLGLNAAHSPAGTPKPLIMVEWESVPTRLSG